VTPRPPIFISAVSKELRSARQLVANTLTFLGYQPVWQDIFGTEGGDLRGLLRQQVDQCKGVVQLVGQYYGAEPPAPDEKFGRVSYTQYEALYARGRGKKVWYLFIDENFPIDAHELQSDELRDLQAAYRRRVQSDAHLFHSLASREALEASVLKLRDDLARLRRGVKQWAGGVVTLLCLIAALVVWLVHGQGQAAKEIGETKKEIAAMTAEMTKMRLAIMKYARVDAQVRESGSSGKEANATQERVYTELGRQLDVDPKALREKLPQLAERLKRAPEASSYERANAAYVADDYLEAERLALKAVEETRKAVSTKPFEVIQALTLAGLSAQRRIQYASAMEHFREAERLTDRERRPVEWAEVQAEIADLLIDQGQYKDGENVLRSVIEVRTHMLGPEHLETLKSRLSLAIALRSQGKSAEAEAETRAVLRLQEKVLGPEHQDTLGSRMNLANTLYAQGKYVEAEVEHRAVLKLQEKVLGPEHHDTLGSRGNLLSALNAQGKYAEAETECRAVLRLQERVLGPEHPDTLISRMNLVGALVDQGKYAEVEMECRAVLRLQEKVLGPEHHDTLMNRMNLAIAMFHQDKYGEAEAEHRTVLKLREKVLGPEHPDTLASRIGLANTLDAQGEHEEAEAEYRAVLKLQEKVLDPEHPQILMNRKGLAITLLRQRKYAEAEAETRVVLKMLGPEHPDTLTNRVVLAVTMFRQRKYAEAGEEYRAVLKRQVKVLGPEHPDTIESQGTLAYCLMTEGKITEAKQFAQGALDGARKTLGPDHPDTKRYEKLCDQLKVQQR
jgi:tetratricopeptide (TPR) repeat protein